MAKGHRFNLKGVCIQCGRSKRAAEHFGWDCTSSNSEFRDSDRDDVVTIIDDPPASHHRMQSDPARSPREDLLQFGIFQTAVGMRRRGLSDDEIQTRFAELGVRSDPEARLLWSLAPITGHLADRPVHAGPPRIFLSHSHRDRDAAAYIQKVLVEANRAETFLDQHQIVPGQKLEDRLVEGLLWCDKVVLMWSSSASQSAFVEWEWRRALLLCKDIIPYVLDSTPRPASLKSLVHIELSDATHGHGQLLKAVLGANWMPTSTATPFPGCWHAEAGFAGLGECDYALELRTNGQIVGSACFKNAGILGKMAGDLGVSTLLSQKYPLTGKWSYDDRGQRLQLEITASLLDQTGGLEVVTIRTTGEEEGWLHGEGLDGKSWRLQRTG